MSSTITYKLYIFDLDGTLYRGDEAIEHAAEVVGLLSARGARIAYVTNNATRSRPTLCAKLRGLGFSAQESEIVTSATAAAGWCQGHRLRSVGVIGEAGLTQSLEEGGIRVFPPDSEWPENLDAVVVGLYREIHYRHIDKAMQAIRAGAEFIATNPDPTFPLEGGRFSPGAGAGVAAIENCVGTAPIVIGKPSPIMMEQALRDAGVTKEEALAVGDRLTTDIESGRRAGIATWLVLTGVETSAPDGQPFSADLTGLPGVNPG